MAEPAILARSGGAGQTGPSAARRRWQSSGWRRCRARTDRRPSGSTCGFPSTRTTQQCRPFARQPLLPHVPRGLGRASRDEADEVRHVAAADQQPAAAGGKPDQLGDPPHGLRFDLGRERRQPPRPDVLVERGGQEIAEHPDRRGTRRDVAEEARMPVEERVVEEQSGGFAHQPAGVGAGRRKRLLCPERPPDAPPAIRRASPARRAPSPVDRRSHRRGDVRSPGTRRLHVKRRLPLSERFELRRNLHRNPSPFLDLGSGTPEGMSYFWLVFVRGSSAGFTYLNSTGP